MSDYIPFEQGAQRGDMGPRPSWDENFLEHARVAAKMSTCERTFKYGGVGCVLVRDRLILATGFCGSIRKAQHCSDTYKTIVDGIVVAEGVVGCLIDPNTGGCARTVHAEINAVLNSASHGIKIEGATAYITMSPCWECFKALANAGVVRIVYGFEYRLGVERQKEFAKRLEIKFEQLTTVLETVPATVPAT